MVAAIELSAVGVATAFAAGFVSFVSPCVLPLVPAYLSFVSGVAYGDLQQNTRRVTIATGFFVLGFTIVFSAYGAGVGWAGSLVNDYRRSLELIGGFFMIVMGLALIGFASRVFGREYGTALEARPRVAGRRAADRTAPSPSGGRRASARCCPRSSRSRARRGRRRAPRCSWPTRSGSASRS